MLQENLELLKVCGVDPARFVWELRPAGITDEDVERTRNKWLPATQRWGDLVSAIMQNSTECLFQKFIDVLLRVKKLEDLAKKMKGILLKTSPYTVYLG